MKTFTIKASELAKLNDWRPSAILARKEQEEVAALLVARGWAVRRPLKEQRCWKSIELKAINDGCGFLYVTEAGEVLSGHTRREAQKVGPQTRKRMLGED